jgi:hypothetical protein
MLITNLSCWSMTVEQKGMQRLNTCTWCILRTSSSLLRVCRAKFESVDVIAIPVDSKGHRGLFSLPPQLRLKHDLIDCIGILPCYDAHLPLARSPLPIPMTIFIPGLADTMMED